MDSIFLVRSTIGKKKMLHALLNFAEVGVYKSFMSS